MLLRVILTFCLTASWGISTCQDSLLEKIQTDINDGKLDRAASKIEKYKGKNDINNNDFRFLLAEYHSIIGSQYESGSKCCPDLELAIEILVDIDCSGNNFGMHYDSEPECSELKKEMKESLILQLGELIIQSGTALEYLYYSIRYDEDGFNRHEEFVSEISRRHNKIIKEIQNLLESFPTLDKGLNDSFRTFNNEYQGDYKSNKEHLKLAALNYVKGLYSELKPCEIVDSLLMEIDFEYAKIDESKDLWLTFLRNHENDSAPNTTTKILEAKRNYEGLLTSLEFLEYLRKNSETNSHRQEELQIQVARRHDQAIVEMNHLLESGQPLQNNSNLGDIYNSILYQFNRDFDANEEQLQQTSLRYLKGIYSEIDLTEVVDSLIMEIDFSYAEISDSKDVWASFLLSYEKDSLAVTQKRIVEARKKYEPLLWADCNEYPSVQSFELFLEKCPNSSLAASALVELEKLMRIECEGLPTAARWNRYILRFPNSEYASVLQKKLSSSCWSTNTSADWQIADNLWQLKRNSDTKFWQIILTDDKAEKAIAVKISDERDGEFEYGLYNLQTGRISRKLHENSIPLRTYCSTTNQFYYYTDGFIKALDRNTEQLRTVAQLPRKFVTDWQQADDVVFERATFFTSKDSLFVTFGVEVEYNEMPTYFTYSFDLNDMGSSSQVFNHPFKELSWNDRKAGLQNEFALFSGDIQEKQKRLKLLYGENIQFIQRNNQKETRTFCVLKPSTVTGYYGELNMQSSFTFYEIRDDIMEPLGLLELWDVDTIIGTKQKIEHAYNTDGINHFQIIEDSLMAFTYTRGEYSKIFVLPLFDEDSESSAILTSHENPDFIEIPFGWETCYFGRGKNSKEILYQKRNTGWISEDGIVTQRRSIGSHNEKHELIKYSFRALYDEWDSLGSNSLETTLTSLRDSLDPSASAIEKYTRTQNAFENAKQSYARTADSLRNEIYKLVQESVVSIQYDPREIFNSNNYSSDHFESDQKQWFLTIPSFNGGAELTYKYSLDTKRAKKYLDEDFDGTQCNVTYYFNPLSQQYEAFSMNIQDDLKEEQLIFPFKDISLRKNLSFTSTEFGLLRPKQSSRFWLFTERNDQTVDSRILRHFVQLGKPKRYFGLGSGKNWCIQNLEHPLGELNIPGTCAAPESEVDYLFFDPTNSFVFGSCKDVAHNARHSQKLIYDVNDQSIMDVNIEELKVTPPNSIPQEVEISLAKDELLSFINSYSKDFQIIELASPENDWTSKIVHNSKVISTSSVNDYINRNIYGLTWLGQDGQGKIAIEYRVNGHASYSPCGRFVADERDGVIQLKNIATEETVFTIFTSQRSANSEMYWDSSSLFFGWNDCIFPLPIVLAEYEAN